MAEISPVFSSLRRFPSSFLLMGMLLTGLSLPAKAAADHPPSDLRVGFYLLHDVSDEESQVHLITMVKTAPPEITDYLKRVSEAADRTLADIGRMEKGDPSLLLGQNPLPPFEQDVRQGIWEDKQHNLLFGTKGSHFVRALLLTQIEATTYLLHISDLLSQEDKDADRARSLKKISKRWEALRDEGFRLLNAR